MPDDVERIVRGLNARQRAAWRACEWVGEYFDPPNLPVWDRPAMRRLGLLCSDGCVTTLGERLIMRLNAPPWWRRAANRFRTALLSSTQGE